MSDYLKILIPSAIGLLTTVIAAYASAHWAVRRAFHERWWARQEQVYSEIIEALHDIVRYSSFELERYKHENPSENPKRQEFQDRYTEAYWKVQKMTDIGPFVISEEAAKILLKLRNRPKFDPDYDDPADVRKEELSCYQEALNGIRNCARHDLKI